MYGMLSQYIRNILVHIFIFGVCGLVCESVGKADLLSDHFDSKQSREAVDLLLTCHLLLTCRLVRVR